MKKRINKNIFLKEKSRHECAIKGFGGNFVLAIPKFGK